MKRLCHEVNQRGAVAVLVALILVVLIGAAGIALDLGRLFVAKTELQNAADACALAAARELATPSTLAVLTRAENAGITVGNRHRSDFQDNPVVFGRDRDVTFSATLNGSYAAKTSAPANVRFVRCTREVAGFLPWFMQVLGAGSQSVGATAVAWAQPGNPTCPIPLAMCSKVTTPDTCASGSPDLLTGLCIGKWYSGRFGAGGGINGNFNWVDFSGGGGGSQEVQEGLEGCVAIENPIEVGDLVDAKAGVLGASAGTSWNTRFGLYKGGAGNPSPEDGAMPDRTGYAYTIVNWTLGRDAFDDYKAKQESDPKVPYGTSTQQGNQTTGLSVSSSYHVSTPAEHATGDRYRRLIAMPTVNCGTWGPGHKAEVTGWACALMLTPYQGPNDEVFLEYRGVAGEPNVPCGTFGSPGGTGPLVPTLVQ